MAAPPKLRVAISGGGIGGLALAAFICQHSKDIAVDLYEARPDISTIGAWIGIWKRTWETLQELGFVDDLRKRNLQLPVDGEKRGPIFRKADQPAPGFDFHNHMIPYGPLTIARPVLLDIFQTKLTDMCTIHTSKQVVDYEQAPGGHVTIKFKDGTTATADVLVGCDGVHSNTRKTMYRDFAASDPSKNYDQFREPKWSGTVAYRGSIPTPKLSEKYPDHPVLTQGKVFCGKNKHVYALPSGPIIGMVWYHTEEGGYGKAFDGPSVADAPEQEVIDCYKGWEPDVIHLVELFEKPSRWAIFVVDGLPHFTSGRVALAGDAAHAMTPHQGVGGGQAIEDAHILGHLLTHEKTTTENLPQVLSIYDAIRRPLAQKASERSWDNGLLFEFMHPEYKVGPDASAEELKPLGEAVGASFAWLAQEGCQEDWRAAETQLLQLA